jgi:hypothetical protein
LVRAADRINIPNLDPKFIAARNRDNNWLIARFIENIDTLNKLAGNLPQQAPWNYKTADEFKLTVASILGSIPEADRELRKLRLWWDDMLGQVQAFGPMTAWRLTEVVSSAVWAMRRDDPVCAAIMARAAIETAASYAWFQTKVRPAIDTFVEQNMLGYIEDLEDELLKTLFASQLEDIGKFYNPMNIVTIIGHISGKIPDQEEVGRCYAVLCEVAHPNMLGRSIYLSEEDGRTIISRERGPSVRLLERNTLLGLSWASGTFPRSVTMMQESCRKSA